MKGDFLVLSPHFTQRGSAPWTPGTFKSKLTCDLRTQNLLMDPRAFNSRLLFNLEEQRPKGIVNIPPMTDKIYFDNCFTVV